MVHKEVAGTYADNGVRYSMGIETNWLSFAGLQGFQRIYKTLLLGEFVSHHYTKVSIAYDFESAYNEVIYYNTQTGIYTGGLYGEEGDTYGDETPYGGDSSDVYQFRLFPRRQKCQSMKLRIEDIDTIGDAAGGSFKLVSMACEVGRKRGANKLGTSKSIGSL